MRAPDMGIYSIENTQTDRVYVGSSSNLSRRLAQHRTALREGWHPNPHLQEELKRDGADAFQIVILQRTADPLELEYLEDLWARRLSAYTPDGYNMRSPIQNTRSVKPDEETVLAFDLEFERLDTGEMNDMLFARQLAALEISRPFGGHQWNAQQVGVARNAVARRQAARAAKENA